MPERCENCTREIGRLETPCVWRGTVVCPNCWRLLSTAHPTQGQREANAAVVIFRVLFWVVASLIIGVLLLAVFQAARFNAGF